MERREVANAQEMSLRFSLGMQATVWPCSSLKDAQIGAPQSEPDRQDGPSRCLKLPMVVSRVEGVECLVATLNCDWRADLLTKSPNTGEAQDGGRI